MNWSKLPVSLSELCIDTTLRCGQSFRWKKSLDEEVYSCAFKGKLISLHQDHQYLYYRSTRPSQTRSDVKRVRDSYGNPHRTAQCADSGDEGETEVFLRHYLNLEPNLEALYEQWSSADKNFSKKAPRFTGVRILRQDAWEALVGFICSSNNNIARISQMMDKLCIHYGSLVGHVDGRPFYDMPPPLALTGSRVESHLRELGFGYRAKYLYQTAVKVSQEPEEWLDSMRNPESPALGKDARDAGELLPGGREGYRMAHAALLDLQGVGPKVADCVCLMGLGWGEAVPVDTHVWQIAQRDYHFGKGRHRSLTKATYDAVADHFRLLWGKEAGWAHSVLFTADLKTFSERLKAKLEIKEEVKMESQHGQVKHDTNKGERSRLGGITIELAPALPVKTESNAEEKPLVELDKQVSLAKKNKQIKSSNEAGQATEQLTAVKFEGQDIESESSSFLQDLKPEEGGSRARIETSIHSNNAFEDPTTTTNKTEAMETATQKLAKTEILPLMRAKRDSTEQGANLTIEGQTKRQRTSKRQHRK